MVAAYSVLMSGTAVPAAYSMRGLVAIIVISVLAGVFMWFHKPIVDAFDRALGKLFWKK